MAVSQPSNLASCWLVDGGASCHVAGFDPGDALQNRTRATIETLVGGGRRIRCEHTGDLTIMVKTSNPTTFSRLTLKDVRVVPGFGLNPLSAPLMEKAGWYLSQGGGQFKAMDSKGRVVFTVGADFKGLYFLKNVTIFNPTTAGTTAPACVRGQRKFPSDEKTLQNSSASHLFAMGVKDENHQVDLLPSGNVCRMGDSQVTRCDTHPYRCLQLCEERDRSFSVATSISSPLPRSSKQQGLLSARRGPVEPMGEEGHKHVALHLSTKPGPLGLCTSRGCGPVGPVGEVQDVSSPTLISLSPKTLGEANGAHMYQPFPANLNLPECYFDRPCDWCFPLHEDRATSAVAVTAKETKRLMDAHVRFGHRNFRSLANALKMRMPSKTPFCQACVEAKSTVTPSLVRLIH